MASQPAGWQVLQERWEIYGFIASYRHLYPIEKKCKVSKVSRNGFYRWYTSGPSKRVLECSLFTDLIKKKFDLSKRRYGSTRIAAQLKRKGYCISRGRVSVIMKANHWFSKHKKKVKVTTDSNHGYVICKNLLNREFNPSRLNAVWVSDITYIPPHQGWL
ncbi:IS3 family transposase [Zunongwangia pacifica]|uniref:IS3 family transposase n=1 Tax=Zunongwangia pacifica TaxID=2911062 RepID=A0A9X2CL67_9FLAO|nr:IS3 family transposase [Zunongwangia pacifica]MCL6218175.1 IS3 family transposase [Zunongwangia pacifica]